MKTGKKRFIGVFAAIFLLVFAATCVFGACGSKEKEATVESVSVSPTSLELTLDSSGEATGTVTATVKMSDSSNYMGDITVGAVSGVSYSMSMSNSSATIIVTATEPVSATSVSVSAGGKSASFTLTVNAYEAGSLEPEPGTEDSYAVSVASENGVTEVEVESTLQLTASVTNNGTAVEGASVTWSQSSDDGGEVSFDETTPGLITGVTAGTVTITATYTPEGGTAVSGSITVTVKAVTPGPGSGTEDSYVVTVTSENGVTEVEVVGSIQLTASVTNNGTAVEGASVTWSQSSEDGGEVEFSETTPGLITGVTAGTVTITATYTPEGGEAVSGTITVTVRESESSGTEHTHVYRTPEWKWNDDYTCTVTWTCTTEGCEEEGNVITKDATVTSSATAATCVTDGETVYTATYTTTDGTVYTCTETKTVTIPATGHTYPASDATEGVSWNWGTDANGNVTASVTVTCTKCGSTETATANVTEGTYVAPTCTTKGSQVYGAKAVVTESVSGATYTYEKENTVELDMAPHTYPAATQTEYFVWSSMDEVAKDDTVSITVKCSVCGNDIETVTATITNIETTDATSDTNGKTVYTATAEINGSEVELSYEVTIPATGHSYPEATDTTCVVWDWENKTENTVTVTIYCKDGDEHVMETGTVTFTTEVTKESSCTENGVLTYTASFTATGNGVTYTSTYDEEIDMTAHTAGTSTVFSDGNWYVACSVCGGACDDPLTTGEGYTFNVTTAEEIKAAATLNGAKIVLAGNITATVEISGTVSIDLSGNTLTGSGAHTITVKAGGVLTIEDTQESGVVDNISTGCAAIFVEAGGVAKLVGGTYTRSLENGDGGTYYTIVNQGTMTISSPVKVETSAATTSSMIENGWATPTDNTTGATATLTIDGGTFSGGANHLVKNDDYGKLVISGGTFTGNGVSIVLNYGELEISNGTFTQESTTNNSLVIWNNGGGVAYPTITISGGTFVGGEYETLYNDSTGTIKISGGTFENSLYAVVYSAGTLEISGGTFKSTGTGKYIYVIWAGDGTVDITNGTFAAGDSSDVLVAAGGDAVVTISGGTFTGETGVTMLYTYKKESEEEITAIITVTGGSFSAAPEGFIADGFATTYDETAGLYVVNKAPAYVVEATISETEITLDLAEGDDQKDLTITVVMSEEESDFEGHVTWTITSGNDVVKIDENGGLSATVTTLGVTGEATITAEIDGTAFTFTVDVHVVDTTPKESGVIASVSADFTTTDGHSWVPDTVENDKTYPDDTGLLSLVTSQGSDSSMAVQNSGLYCGGKTQNSGRYFKIDLTNETYVGKYVTISAVMCTTTNNNVRSLMLTTDYSVISTGSSIAYVSSSMSSDRIEFSYTMYVESATTLYLTWDANIYIYYIGVTVAEDLVPTQVPESATLAAAEGTLTLISGEIVTTELTLAVTVNGVETSYAGGYTVSSSNIDVVTVDANEDGTFTVTAVGIGTATISVSLWNAPSIDASCTITVEANYVGSITMDPTSLTIEKGETGQFTFSVSVTTKAGETYTGAYDISVESKDTDVAVDDWDTNGSYTVTVSAVGQGMTSIVITVTVDGVVLVSDECVIEVTDSNQTSLYVDFSNSSTYYWIETDTNDAIINKNNTTWIVTLVATTSMKIASGYMTTASASDGAVRYIEIDLSQYEGMAMSVTATMRSNSSSNRSLMLSTTSSNTSTTSSNTLAYATSSSTSDEKLLTYTCGITEGLKLYLTWDNSIRIYDFKIEILGDLEPEVQGVSLSEDTLTLRIGKTESAELTATVKMNIGDYSGQYNWSVEGDAVTISGDGATITVNAVTSIVESATATVKVAVGDFTATCVVTVLIEGEEREKTKYTVHYTIGSDGFVTESVLPDDEDEQVKISYTGTWSSNTSDRNYTYTDSEGNEYKYSKGLKIKAYNSLDVEIEIPEEATDVTITFIVYCGSTSDRTASLTDSTGEALKTSETLNTSGATAVVTLSELEAGEYHIIASNDLHLLGVFVTYTI